MIDARSTTGLWRVPACFCVAGRVRGFWYNVPSCPVCGALHRTPSFVTTYKICSRTSALKFWSRPSSRKSACCLLAACVRRLSVYATVHARLCMYALTECLPCAMHGHRMMHAHITEAKDECTGPCVPQRTHENMELIHVRVSTMQIHPHQDPIHRSRAQHPRGRRRGAARLSHSRQEN